MTKSLIQRHKSQQTWSVRLGKAGQSAAVKWKAVALRHREGFPFPHGLPDAGEARARPSPQRRVLSGWSGPRMNPRSRRDRRGFSPTHRLMESHATEATGALVTDSSHGGFYLSQQMAMRATTQHISLLLLRFWGCKQELFFQRWGNQVTMLWLATRVSPRHCKDSPNASFCMFLQHHFNYNKFLF